MIKWLLLWLLSCPWQEGNHHNYELLNWQWANHYKLWISIVISWLDEFSCWWFVDTPINLAKWLGMAFFFFLFRIVRSLLMPQLLCLKADYNEDDTKNGKDRNSDREKDHSVDEFRTEHIIVFAISHIALPVSSLRFSNCLSCLWSLYRRQCCWDGLYFWFESEYRVVIAVTLQEPF